MAAGGFIFADPRALARGRQGGRAFSRRPTPMFGGVRGLAQQP